MTTYYQVTIISADCEVGYGQGESVEYATQDAMESLDWMGRQYCETFGYTVMVNH